MNDDFQITFRPGAAGMNETVSAVCSAQAGFSGSCFNFPGHKHRPAEAASSAAASCGRLDISRSTFYCHFSGISEIIETESEKFIQSNEEQQEKLGISSRTKAMMNREQIRAIILSAEKSRKEAIFLFRSDVNCRCYQYILQSIMTNMDQMLHDVPQPLRGYMCRYLGEGILSSVHHWLIEQDITIEELVNMLYTFTIGSIERTSAGHYG